MAESAVGAHTLLQCGVMQRLAGCVFFDLRPDLDRLVSWLMLYVFTCRDLFECTCMFDYLPVFTCRDLYELPVCLTVYLCLPVGICMSYLYV